MKHSLLFIASAAFILVLSSFNTDDCDDKGVILSFDPLKCGGCWGWVIKVGQDTIKTNHLPISNEEINLIEYPQKVHISVGEKVDGYDYYKIDCLELVHD